MKKGLFLRAILITLFALCSHTAISCEGIHEKLRKLSWFHSYLAQTFESSKSLTKETGERALSVWLKVPHLLPENGVVHVIGPGDNYFEWAIFLLVRPDIKQIIISEIGRNNIGDNYDFDVIWPMLNKKLPLLLARSKIDTVQALKKLIDEKIWYNTNINNSHFPKHPRPFSVYPVRPESKELPIPKADLILSANPNGTLIDRHADSYFSHLKPSGIIWIITEFYDKNIRLDESYGQNYIPLNKSYLSLLMPSDPIQRALKRVEFLGQGVFNASNAFLLMHPTLKQESIRPARQFESLKSPDNEQDSDPRPRTHR